MLFKIVENQKEGEVVNPAENGEPSKIKLNYEHDNANGNEITELDLKTMTQKNIKTTARATSMDDFFGLKRPCDPGQCPVPHQCPYSDDGLDHCQIEIDYLGEIQKWFEKLPESPATRLRVRGMLIPLFKSYLWLKLFQGATEHVAISREIRATVKAMDTIINRVTKV